MKNIGKMKAFPNLNTTPIEKTKAAEIMAMAKKSCKHCYGTGTTGTRILNDGKREVLICLCALRAAREKELAEKGKADEVK